MLQEDFIETEQKFESKSDRLLEYVRSTINMPEEFTLKMKKHAKENDIAFSALIKLAPQMYVENDDDNCFVKLAKEHAGTESADEAAEILEFRNIKQSHFLGHTLSEVSKALHQLEDTQDWHKIKFKIDDPREIF